MRCHPCLSTYLEVRTREGTGTVAACFLELVDGHYYRTTTTVRTFANGSYFETFSYPEEVSTNGSSCGDLAFTTDYDAGFNYGAFLSESTTYADEVTVTTAQALDALEWEDPSEAEALGTLTVPAWPGFPVDIAARASASILGATASALATAVQIRVARGYRGLPLSLFWTSTSTSGTLVIPTNGDWSAWLELSGDDEEITTAEIRVGRYR